MWSSTLMILGAASYSRAVGGVVEEIVMVAPVWPRTERVGQRLQLGAHGPLRPARTRNTTSVIRGRRSAPACPGRRWSEGTTDSVAGPARPLRQGVEARDARPGRCRRWDPAVGALDDGGEHGVVGTTADEGAHRAVAPASATTTSAEVDELSVVLAWSVDQMPPWPPGARAPRRDGAPHDAVVLGFGAIPTEPDAERDAAAREMVEGGHLFGQEDRLVLGGQQNSCARPMREVTAAAVDRRPAVEAALVVVETNAADESRGRVLLHREVGVLG